MIQRIQSVYFLLAGIFPAFTFCTPMAQYLNGKGEVEYTLNSIGMTATDGTLAAQPWGLLLFTVFTILLGILCIFGYKNRRRQMVMSTLLVSVTLVLALTYVAYGYSYGTSFDLRFLPSWGIVFPVLSFVCTLLARRGIRKDEELVRAADRIR